MKGNEFTKEQRELVTRIYQDEERVAIVSTLMDMLSSESIETARFFVQKCNEITDIAIEMAMQKVLEANQATFWLLSQKHIEDKKSYFASMVPVCKFLFPNGEISDMNNGPGKEYFEQFLKLLGDKKVFSFENPSDASWAESFGHKEYLETVIRKGGERKC